MKNYSFMVLVVVLLMACGHDNKNINQIEVSENDSLTFKIAYVPTLDCLPLYVAQELTLFKKEGVDVSLVPYKSNLDRDTALVSNSVNAIVSDIFRTEYLKQRGTKLNYWSTGGCYWFLFTNKRSNLVQLDSLDNKMIAMSRFSAAHYIADTLMCKVGLGDTCVFFIQINDINTRLNMLRNNQMDALIIPEPYAAIARNDGHHELFCSENISLRMGTFVTKELAKDDTLRLKQLSKVLNAYNMACDSIDKYGIKFYSNLISDFCNIQKEHLDSVRMDFKFGHAEKPKSDDVDKVIMWLLRQ